MTKTFEERLSAVEAAVGTKKTTRILVIQDRSGSMQSRVIETISGYNEYIEELAHDNSDNAFLTLIQFDDEYLTLEESTPIYNVQKLNKDTYVPRGMTALLDAVGRGITDLKKQMNKGDRALVVIMTDGVENASNKYNRTQIQELIRKCEKKGNWTFVFLGAGTDSWTGGQILGLNRKQSVFYGEDGFSHGSAYRGLGVTTSSLRRSEDNTMANAGVAVADYMEDEGATVEPEKDKEIEINLSENAKKLFTPKEKSATKS